MEGNSQEILASSNLDLRPFLEMYLLGKPNRDGNYERANESIEELFLQKKIVDRTVQTLNKFRNEYSMEVVERDHKAEAVRKCHSIWFYIENGMKFHRFSVGRKSSCAPIANVISSKTHTTFGK